MSRISSNQKVGVPDFSPPPHQKVGVPDFFAFSPRASGQGLEWDELLKLNWLSKAGKKTETSIEKIIIVYTMKVLCMRFSGFFDTPVARWQCFF